MKQSLQHAPKHVRFGNKDYIILKDIDGQIRILNRQGKDRIRVKKIDNISNNDVFGYRNTFSTTSKKYSKSSFDSSTNFRLNKITGLKLGMLYFKANLCLYQLKDNA